jgi:RES domain-containing protein
VLYMSENRALCVLEVLVHLTDTLPDKYVLGQADIPNDLSYERVHESALPPNWKTLSVSEQTVTRQIGDEWLTRKSSAILWVPSVVVGEQNILCNPEHPGFERIHFYDPVPFAFDMRLSPALARIDPSSN